MASFLNIQCCCAGYFLLAVLWTTFAGYSYLVDRQRLDDDPEKKNYHVSGVFMVPLFWPFILVGWAAILLLRALHFGLFLILFTLAVIFIRESEDFTGLDKISTSIGDMLLDANSALLNLAFGRSPARS